MTDANRIEELQAKVRTLTERIREAEAEITEIRFKDVPRYERGALVLVPRTLLGEVRPWAARIQRVNLQYLEGTDAGGGSWESRTVAYSVCLQQKDGSFGGSTEGYCHDQVQLLLPGDAEAEDD